MKTLTTVRVGLLVITALALLNFIPGASANVIGGFSVANCGAGGVMVIGPPGNSIDWLASTGIGGGGVDTGCTLTGGDTTLTYFNGASTVALGTGTSGTVNDLTLSPPSGADDFFFFASAPTLDFILTGIGPGVASTACAGLAIGDSCSVFAGSPFILTATATGTAITLDASGIVTDAGPFTSHWFGAFTTQIPGVTAASIQATILGGGSITSTYSGEFLAAVPEPVTTFMIGGGLIALGLLIRRQKLKA